jgi:hypothetical protein
MLLEIVHRWLAPACAGSVLTHETKGCARVQCILRSLIGQEGQTGQVHFTREGEGLRVQRNYHGWKIYMDSYMKKYKECFMICHK